jgi:chaperonin GroEL
MLNDLAILTGATVVSDDTGLTLDKVTGEHLGSAERVEVTKDHTTVVNGSGSKEAIAERISVIETQIEASESQYDREGLEDRLSKLDGGVAVIRVGAATEVEMKEKKDRIDDALHATHAAVEDGIVAGGGVALLRAKQNAGIITGLNADQDAGIAIVMAAIESPLRQITSNAGDSSDVVVANILAGTGDFGYNAATGEYGDMIELGIIDPTKVTKTALVNAASIASLLLTSECTITEVAQKDAGNAPQMPMM